MSESAHKPSKKDLEEALYGVKSFTLGAGTSVQVEFQLQGRILSIK